MWYLRATWAPLIMHLPNSTTVVAEKAQQLPQAPWFLIGCMHLWVR